MVKKATKAKTIPKVAPAPPKRVKFIASRDCALGAGRIPRGTVIFTAERIGPKGWDAATVEPVEGPGLGDSAEQNARVIKNALKNPHLLEVQR